MISRISRYLTVQSNVGQSRLMHVRKEEDKLMAEREAVKEREEEVKLFLASLVERER